MWTVLCHALLCSLTGAALAAGVATQLDDADLVTPAALGALTSGLAGGIVALSYQRRLHSLSKRTVVVPPPLRPKRSARPLLWARISANYRWQALSRPVCQLARRTARSLRNRPVFDVLHPEDYGVLDKALRRARVTGQPQTILCRLLVPIDTPASACARTTFRSDTELLPPLDPATFRHVRLRLRARHDDTGAVTHFACRFADLSPPIEMQRELERARLAADTHHRKLRRVNADLSRLKESYRELYHNAPVMYFRLDVDGRLVAFNDTLLGTLGYRRDQLHAHSYADLLEPAAGKPPPLPRGQAPFEEGKVRTRWRTRSGAVLDVQIHTVADRDEQGEVVRFRSAAIDFTEKNQLTSALRSRGDELERTNQRLLTINTELEAFTYAVSHDLKQPLRTLQTYSKRLHEEFPGQLGADGFQYINHLINASDRLGLLIDDLLNLSRAGRITHSAQAFDLIEAVAPARNDLADLIERKEATVLTEGSLPRVVGDRQRIIQLLTNLIANGLKYNQDPQPQVVIAATVQQGPGGLPLVQVSVRDNGIGIDPKYHKQIFSIFRRAPNMEQYEGTGAGLAICEKIVQAHGGSIWVESQPGAGATFFFTLPDVPAPSEPTPSEPAPRSRQLPRPIEANPPRAEPARPRANRVPVTTAAPAGPHIVLVEDDFEPGEQIQRHGRRAGLSFFLFTTAEAAWTHLQDGQPPDLLMFDINLPGMSGIELCKRIRTLPALRDTPVVMFERDQLPERLAELRAAGANFFLSKDLLADPAQWTARLQAILDQVRQPAARAGG